MKNNIPMANLATNGCPSSALAVPAPPKALESSPNFFTPAACYQQTAQANLQPWVALFSTGTWAPRNGFAHSGALQDCPSRVDRDMPAHSNCVCVVLLFQEGFSCNGANVLACSS